MLFGCSTRNVTNDCDNTINKWDHFITKDSVQVLVTRLQTVKNEGLIDSGMVAQSYLFSSAKEMIRNMMLRDSCEGIRVYYGLTADNRLIPIVCGVTKDGSDIYWSREMEGKTANGTGKATFTVEGLCDMSQDEPPPLTSGNYINP